MNKKKRKEPLVSDEVKTHPSKKPSKYTVWIYERPFGFSEPEWNADLNRNVYKLIRTAPEWRKYAKYPTYCAAVNAIKAVVQRHSSLVKGSTIPVDFPFYWIGDTPPSTE